MNILFIILPIVTHSLLVNPFLNHWHCIGIQEKINFEKPFSFNVGDLSLILWKNDKEKDSFSSTINICKHMGSKLDHSQITKDGCLKCPYHGLEYSSENKKDVIGKTILHEGKLFWSYKPLKNKPEYIPFYNHPNYEKSFLEIEMPCSLQDSAYNTMDLLHPEYVHNNLFGFGNSIPPKNVIFYDYNNTQNITPNIGLSFDYYSKSIVTKGFTQTDNFHLFVYPSFSWSRVSFEKNHLYIGVNLLPTGIKKTKWYITVCHNFYKKSWEKQMLKMMAVSILTQDYIQMKNQAIETNLKKAILFNKKFENEEPVLRLNRYFTDCYKYVDMNDCVNLYDDYKNSLP